MQYISALLMLGSSVVFAAFSSSLPPPPPSSPNEFLNPLSEEYTDPFIQQETQGVATRINIDGEDFPGTFDWQGVYVEIAEKVDRSMCSVNY